MLHRPLGYDPQHVMSVGIPIHEHTLTTWAERSAYFAQLHERVAAIPGVVSAGISSNATPPNNGWKQPFEILGKTAGEQQEVLANFISPEYFGILHIPLMQGRLWDKNEVARGAALAVVNEAFVNKYFPGEEIIGRSVRLPRLKSEPPYRLAAAGSDGWLQITGIVADALDNGMDKPILPGIYVPYTLNMFMGTQILVRTQGVPLDMLHSIREQIAAVNPDQQVFSRVDDLESWIKREPEWARSRLISILFAAFSGLALTLAAVGLYSVVSYSVVQRTGEFGIRMALGAQRVQVMRMVLLSATTSVGIGLAVGLGFSLGLGRVVSRWVNQQAHDPFIAFAVSLLIVAIAAVACLIPARRALSVDPMTALRRE